MYDHVGLEHLELREATIAHLTRERLLVLVDELVPLQVRLLVELAAADLARVRLLPSVRELMGAKMMLL